MTEVLQNKDYIGKAVLYMAMELSNAEWKLNFSDGNKERIVRMDAGELRGVTETNQPCQREIAFAGRLSSCELLRSGSGRVLDSPDVGGEWDREFGIGPIEHRGKSSQATDEDGHGGCVRDCRGY